ncbi:MAG: response regulator [Thermomicrobiales bacterium]
MIRIGCIEADADLREMLDIILGDAGFETAMWPVATGAQAFLRRERPDVLLLEMRFDGDYAGVQVLQELRDDPATAAIAAIACTGDIHFLRTHDRALRALNSAVLEKPFTADQLLGAIRRALDPPRFSLRNRKAPRCQCVMLT